MNRLLPLLVGAVLLTACSGGSTDPEPTPTMTTSMSPSPSVTGSGSSPSTEQTAWAGQVCTDLDTLKTSIQGLATAAEAGGGDVSASLSAQFDTIKMSATTFVSTVGAVPAGSGDDPDQVALQSSSQKLRSSLDTLEKTVTEMQGASGAAMVQGLAAVVAAANASLTALGATAEAIGTAAKDSKGKIGQAFAANSSCASLRT